MIFCVNYLTAIKNKKSEMKYDIRRYSTISRPRVLVEVENLLDFEENLFFFIFFY